MSAPDPDLVEIRTAGVDDLDHLVSLEGTIYPDPWTHGMFLQELSRMCAPNWLASAPGSAGVVGYVIGMVEHDELHIGNLAVVSDFRRRGIGRRLLERCIDSGRDRGAREAWLEVRASNSGAIELYLGAGFRVVGRRPGYYQADDFGSREDALMLCRPLVCQEDRQ